MLVSFRCEFLSSLSGISGLIVSPRFLYSLVLAAPLPSPSLLRTSFAVAARRDISPCPRPNRAFGCRLLRSTGCFWDLTACPFVADPAEGEVIAFPCPGDGCGLAAGNAVPLEPEAGDAGLADGRAPSTAASSIL